jgi:hypothetical protein
VAPSTSGLKREFGMKQAAGSFNPEDGGDTFTRSFAQLAADFMESYSKSYKPTGICILNDTKIT